MMWLRQMAQLSTTMSARNETGGAHQTGNRKLGLGMDGREGEQSGWIVCLPQAQRATAFHFLISKRLVGLREEEGPAAEEPSAAAAAGAAGGGASVSMADISSRGGDRLCLAREF